MIKRRQIWETKDSKLNRKLTKENEISYTRGNRREIDKGNKEIEKGNREIRKEKRNKGREKGRTEGELTALSHFFIATVCAFWDVVAPEGKGHALPRGAGKYLHVGDVAGNSCHCPCIVSGPSSVSSYRRGVFCSLPRHFIWRGRQRKRLSRHVIWGGRQRERGYVSKIFFWSGFVSCGDRFDDNFFFYRYTIDGMNIDVSVIINRQP